MLADFQRASKSFQSEFTHEARAARRRWFAWNQSATVASLERVARQPLRRSAVSLDEQRREILRLVLVLESVDEIFGRELIRGSALVAEQIVDGVIVLAVSQPSQRRCGPRSAGVCGFLFVELQRVGYFAIRHFGQAPNPAFKYSFLFAAGFIPLASGVRDAICGLLQEPRFFRLVAVNQRDQRSAEGLDLIGVRVRFRELQSRNRRHAIRVMARPAGSLLQNRVKRPRESAFLSRSETFLSPYREESKN